MKIAEPKKFKLADYVEEMANQTGVPVENVKVTSTEMIMSVGYSFKAKVTEDQAESAIATALKIEQSQVSVEILGRRLEEQLRGRSLTEETKIKATITMAANDEQQRAKAQAAHEKLADTGKSSEMLKSVQKALKEDAKIDVELPEVTEAYQVDVKVQTEIKAVSQARVVFPTGDDLQEVAKKAGAEDIEVQDEVVLPPSPPVGETSTTTTTPISDKSRISAGSISLPPLMILSLALAAPLLV